MTIKVKVKLTSKFFPNVSVTFLLNLGNNRKFLDRLHYKEVSPSELYERFLSKYQKYKYDKELNGADYYKDIDVVQFYISYDKT